LKWRLQHKSADLSSRAWREGSGTAFDCRGHKANLTNIEELYHPTPLEVSEERLSEEDVPHEDAEN